MEPISLGPFDLIEPIGRGGMGEVWRGLHRGQNLPVAVKVLPAPSGGGEMLAAFRIEVQAVAGLNHPGIVMVFDYGEVGPRAEAASGGRLGAKSPFLVMELLTGGRLDHQPLPDDWRSFKGILLDILDALAFAHARGVIHRDLKLNNVLLGARSDVRPGFKLIDFGLATVATREPGEGHPLSAGTPAFEAPEKILGRRRDQGPWTDLYSFGCMAYALAAGHPPFHGEDPDQILRCHVMVPPPPLNSRVPVPKGFEGWLKRLMAKHPNDRFRRAADAAHALHSLGDEAKVPKPLPHPAPPPSPQEDAVITVKMPSDADQLDTQPVVYTWSEPGAGKDGDRLRASAALLAPPEEDAAPILRPPMPEDWRTAVPEETSLSMMLVGAGLGLYGLRSIPLVNRDAERDAIWQELLAVRREGAARLVLLHGDAGNGKSRLAQWVAEFAHALGVATPLTAIHSPMGEVGDGLQSMVRRHLGCVGLSRARTLERTARILAEQGIDDEYERHALTELMVPAAAHDRPDGERVVRFRSPIERYVLVARLIQRLSEQRPVIVWIEDVQWGADAIGFCRHLLDAQDLSPSAVLLLLTVRDPSLLEHLQTAQDLDEVMGMPRTRPLEVGPLGASHMSQLVEGLLGLEGDLARQVEQRSGGNPLFAVQLVGDWVQRGVLEVAETGFQLRGGERAILPDDIHQVWTARIERLLESQPRDARLVLELAAALGRAVHPEEWRALCQLAGVSLPDTLVEALLAGRLAHSSDDGWNFVHGMLVESLERAAREAGRWARHHRCCADLLRPRFEAGEEGVAERLGRHYLAAGDFAKAVEPLFRAAKTRADTSEHRAALAILADIEGALGDLDVEDQDPRWGRAWVLRARVFAFQGEFDAAIDMAKQAEGAARQHDWPVILADAVWNLAYADHQRGQLDRAVDLYREALGRYEALGTDQGVAESLNSLGEVFRLRGQHDEAEDFSKRALALFRKVADAIGMAAALRNLGVVAQGRGQLDEAVDLNRRAMGTYEKAGNNYGVAVCLNDLAEVLRLQGDLETAERGYRRALAIHEAIGTTDAILMRLNLGLVLLTRRRFRQARAVLEEGRQVLLRIGRRGFLGAAHTALLPCAANARDWRAWDVHFQQAVRLLSETQMIDRDIAWPAELGGDLARQAGQPERARLAYELSLAQWQALGDEPQAERVAKRLVDSDA